MDKLRKIAKRDHLPKELPREAAEEIAAFRAILSGRQPPLTQSLQEVVSYAKKQPLRAALSSRSESKVLRGDKGELRLLEEDSRSRVELLLTACEEFLKASECRLKNSKILFSSRAVRIS